MFLQTVLMALSFTALVATLPSPIDIEQSLQKLQARDYPDKYTLYLGDGSANDGWPSMDQWMPLHDLFIRNQPLMTQSCSQFNATIPNDLQSETSEVYTAITNISSVSGVDSRFILAIIMQASGGCVRAPTTVNADGQLQNPGIMQSHNGPGTCNSNGVVLNPCPQNQVTQMVRDGTVGTNSGRGLSEILNELGSNVTAPQSYYETARIYNSGSIAPSGNLEDSVTRCYASDIANRLLGWAFAPQASSCVS